MVTIMVHYDSQQTVEKINKTILTQQCRKKDAYQLIAYNKLFSERSISSEILHFV